MDKNAIEKYAVWARSELIERLPARHDNGIAKKVADDPDNQ